MARSNDRAGSGRRAPKDAGRRLKKKPCSLCKDRVEWVDYKDVALLRKFMSDRGKIRARRVSGNCTQHQREVAVAIKTARELVLLPYTQRTTTERPGGRRGYGGGSGRRGRDSERAAAPAEAAPAAPAEATEGAPADQPGAPAAGGKAATGGNGARPEGTEADAVETAGEATAKPKPAETGADGDGSGPGAGGGSEAVAAAEGP